MRARLQIHFGKELIIENIKVENVEAWHNFTRAQKQD